MSLPPPKKEVKITVENMEGHQDEEEDNIVERHMDDKSFDISFEKHLEKQLNENLNAGHNV